MAARLTSFFPVFKIVSFGKEKSCRQLYVYVVTLKLIHAQNFVSSQKYMDADNIDTCFTNLSKRSFSHKQKPPLYAGAV